MNSEEDVEEEASQSEGGNTCKHGSFVLFVTVSFFSCWFFFVSFLSFFFFFPSFFSSFFFFFLFFLHFLSFFLPLRFFQFNRKRIWWFSFLSELDLGRMGASVISIVPEIFQMTTAVLTKTRAKVLHHPLRNKWQQGEEKPTTWQKHQPLLRRLLKLPSRRVGG